MILDRQEDRCEGVENGSISGYILQVEQTVFDVGFE